MECVECMLCVLCVVCVPNFCFKEGVITKELSMTAECSTSSQVHNGIQLMCVLSLYIIID